MNAENDMTTIVFISLLVGVFTIYQIAATLLNVRQIRHLRDVRRRVVTQRAFGKLRHDLMMLAADGELPSDSVTFLNFYLLNTAVMRNPDRYNEAAKFLRQTFLTDRLHDSD